MINQGLLYLKDGHRENFKNLTKKELKTDVETLEDDYDKYLKEFRRKYLNYARTFNETSDQEKSEARIKITAVNKKLSDTAEKIYNKIVKFETEKNKINKKKDTTLHGAKKLLKGYNKTNKELNHIDNARKRNTFYAFEQDFKYKVESARLRYVGWGILAVMLLFFAIKWLVYDAHFTKLTKIVVIGAASIVAMGFLSTIWSILIAYCQVHNKGILCLIIHIFNRTLKGLFGFLSALLS